VLAALVLLALALMAGWQFWRGESGAEVAVPVAPRAGDGSAPRARAVSALPGPALTPAALRARLELRTRADGDLSPAQACLLAEALWACKSLEDLTLTLAGMADRGQVDPNSPAFAGLIDPEQHAACEVLSPADHARAYALQRLAALQGGVRLQQSFVMSPALGHDERRDGAPRYDDYRALAGRWLDAWWQAPRRDTLLALLGHVAPDDVQVFRPAYTRPDPLRFVALVHAAQARGVRVPADITRHVAPFEAAFTPEQRLEAEGMAAQLTARWRDPPGAAEPFRFERDACTEDEAQ
jgi:hypothetical protein